MTSIQDYLDSIRQSLSEIEQATDTTREPRAESNRLIQNLDTLAEQLATRYEQEAAWERETVL